MSAPAAKKSKTAMDLVGAAIVGQSGGPTVVINQSLVGYVLEAVKHKGKITRVLGMKHGLKGLINEDIIDLGAESAANLEAVGNVPAAALGSVRMKPTPDDIAAMIPMLRKYDIRFFFYIGGNDSAHTAHIVNEESAKQGYEMACFHIPKTIDNDLCVTDHCPGFASAARFVAHAFQGDDRDLRAMGGCKINIVMGRDAGWLTAAATLGRRTGDENDGPHLVYCPEVAFDPEEFVSSVEAIMKRLGRCLVAVSEGINNGKGELFMAQYAKANGAGLEKDSHGNVSMGGTGILGDILAKMVKDKIGGRVRADTFGYVQRGFHADTSSVDAAEARMVGQMAVEAAVNGKRSGSMAIRRTNGEGEPYASKAFVTPLKTVAKVTKELPVEWIVGGNDIGPEFAEYAMPLTGGIGFMADLACIKAVPASEL